MQNVCSQPWRHVLWDPAWNSKFFYSLTEKVCKYAVLEDLKVFDQTTAAKIQGRTSEEKNKGVYPVFEPISLHLEQFLPFLHKKSLFSFFSYWTSPYGSVTGHVHRDSESPTTAQYLLLLQKLSQNRKSEKVAKSEGCVSASPSHDLSWLDIAFHLVGWVPMASGSDSLIELSFSLSFFIFLV